MKSEKVLLTIIFCFLSIQWIYASDNEKVEDKPKNQINLDLNTSIGPINNYIYGGFLEHLGRVVYTSIYAPNHPASDKNGLRQDTIKALREMGATIYRYPGGNFVSGYDWLDGVGPKEKRPKKIDRAWGGLETNQFGTDEFMIFLSQVEGKGMLAVNLGTGTAKKAAALVEYCNGHRGMFANKRIKYGHQEPYKIEYWCLGNEMTYQHQIGHMSPAKYARKAALAARMMRKVDSSIKCVASLNYKEIARNDVLSTGLLNEIDFVSAHFYRVNNRKNEKRYLAVGMGLDDYLKDARRTLSHLSKIKQSQLYMCFDEWGARLEPEWHKRTPNGNLHEGEYAAPIGEWPIYLVDAIVDAQFFNAFIRNADLVQVANYSTLVNWFAPIRTNDEVVLEQIFFYIFKLYREYGQGLSLRPQVISETYFDKDVEIPYLDVSVCYQNEANTIRLFIVNRDMENKRSVKIILKDKAFKDCNKAIVIGGQEPYSYNSFREPRQILPKYLKTEEITPSKIELEPLSLTFVEFQIL